MPLSRWWIAAPLAAVLSSLSLSPAAATVARLSGPELAAGSPHVVVAVVEDAHGRWEKSLIVTEYSLRIEERLRGDSPDRVTVSIPGGTVGGETHETSVSFPLEVGARYLLFLGDLGRPTLTPVTGAWQGVFREDDPVSFSGIVDAARALVEGRPVPALAAAEGPAAGLAAPRPREEKYTLGTLAVPPVSFSVALPADSPFVPVFERQLATWNVYGGDLFRLSPGTATWAYGNGVFDFAGFPTDAQMNAQVGRTWGAGAISFVTGRVQNGQLVEADIALNPAQRWTLDAGEATRPGAPLLFQDAVLGALGIAWGLRSPFEVPGNPFEFQEVWWDSVLNIRAQQYRLATLFADDTAAVRKAFGGVPLRDGAISSYTVARTGLFMPDYVPTGPSLSAVRPGRSFNVPRRIKIENTGTVPLSKLTVDVYLTPSRFSLQGAILVKKLRPAGTIQRGDVLNVTPGRLTVPASAPAGTYFLAFVLKDGKDVYPANNTAWSDYNVTVRVVR